jgi:hypothetical protein
MSNVLMIPASGAIIFDSQSPNSSIISPLSAAPRLSYDNAGGLNITSYTTGVSTFDRFTVDGSYGRLFGVSDSVTGVVFSVNDAAGLPIVEVESNFTDKITMGTYGTNALVVNDNKIGIGNPAPTAKLDIAETWNSNITVTGASGTGSIATITFAAQSAAIVVGSTIVVASINPSGYNGTFVVTASTTTSVSYANATTAAWVSGGNIQQLFTSVKLNVTNTSSHTASKLLDLQVGGSSLFSVKKDGLIQGTSPSYNLSLNGDCYIYNGATARASSLWGDECRIVGGPLVLSDSVNVNVSNISAGVAIYKDSANNLAQRNLANAQTFRVYNSTDATPATNFDRATFGWTSNVLRIGTEMGGSYTTARGIDFITNGTVRMSIAAGGLVTIDGVAIGRGLAANSLNVAIGNGTLVSNTTGSYNSALGVNALVFNTTGTTNSAFGTSALFGNTTGSNNSAIGVSAGHYIADGTTVNSTGGNSVFIGTSTKALANAQTNQIVIGYDAIGLGSNSAVLGNSSITTTALRGNVGIGTTAPSVQLDVLSALIANCANFTIKNNNASWTGTRFGWSQGDGSLPFGLTIGGYNTSGNKLIKFIPDNSPAGIIFSGVDELYSFESRLVTAKGITGSYHTDLDIVLRQHTNGGSDKGIKFKLNGGSLTAMSIMETGKVGIGTENPVADLDIAETWNAPAISVTGASGTGTTATITFATQATAIQVGSTIVVASINPAGYNGTFVVTASSTTSVSYANATTAAWVSGGTIQQLFTSVKVNVTDTASNSGSNLMDLQVGGVSKLSITKLGGINMSGAISVGTVSVGSAMVISQSGGSIRAANGTAINLGSADSSSTDNFANLFLRSSAVISFGGETKLFSDSTGVLAQRNLANAQAFRVYNSTDATPATNFDRATFGWTSNVLKIGTEMGGSYTTARYLELLVGGVTKVTISPAWVTFGDAVFADKTITIKGSGTTTAKAITVSNNASAERFSIQDNGIINHTLSAATYYAVNQRNTNIVGWLGNGSTYFMNFDTLNGRVSFGDIQAPTERVEVSGNIRASNLIISPAASVTPPNNGDLTFQATSNTSVTLKLKGTDGVVRSASLTLA